MPRRAYAALGVFTTEHGAIYVRRQYADKQGTWLLICEGPHEALRAFLPDWRPRSPSTRTQITPPKPMQRVGEIMSFYHALVPIWTERLKRPVQPVVPAAPLPVYRVLGDLIAIVDQEAAIALRTGSLQTYRCQWKTILTHLPASTSLHALTRERLQALMGELGATYASTTVQNLRTALNMLLVHALDDGVLARNPLAKVKTPKPVTRPRTFLTEEQRDRVLQVAAEDGREVHLLFALLLLTGVRKAEALALTWADVDEANHVLHVRGGEHFVTKTGDNRTVPICDDLWELLQRYRQARGFILKPDKQYGGGRYRWSFAKAFRSVVRRAGVPWCFPHLCRHAFASLYLHNGGSFFRLASHLGHSISETTELYAHCMPGFDEDINGRNRSTTESRHGSHRPTRTA
jgi:integrase/recombinase XerD